MKRKLVPVMVKDCTLDGLLKTIVHINLVSLTEEEAEAVLFKGLLGTRQKPGTAPVFPGRQSSVRKAFPSNAGRTESTMSDLDHARFLKQSFHIIKQYFRDGIEELATHPAVDAEFTDISAMVFTAEVFINGRKVARCKIWFGEGSFANQICYYEGNNNYGNAFNEALSIAHDDYELCLSALMKMGFNRTEAVKKMDLNKLSSEEAAEYLWQRFISKLS